MLDQAFHLLDFDNSEEKPLDVLKKYTNTYSGLPYVPDTHWHLRFTHLIGYGAKYYSYLISKSIASKIWAECFEKEPLSSTAGRTYRQNLLAYGGERRPHELIKSIGVEIENHSLVQSLVEHL
jgi:mitochondrial intermediate peptidase